MESTWAEFQEFANEEDIKTVRPIYDKSLAKLEKLRPLEDALVCLIYGYEIKRFSNFLLYRK